MELIEPLAGVFIYRFMASFEEDSLLDDMIAMVHVSVLLLSNNSLEIAFLGGLQHGTGEAKVSINVYKGGAKEE